jgi:ParB-like nuclease domain
VLSSQPQNPVENRSPKELRAHRQAALVPSMTVAEAQALEADIAERGIQVPLEITAAGVVLDGRHRHRVALALGLETVPVRVIDPPDQLEYMLLAAFQRRHLDTGQRAFLVLELEGYRQRRAEAALRKSANLRNSAEAVTTPPQSQASRHAQSRTRSWSKNTAPLSTRNSGQARSRLTAPCSKPGGRRDTPRLERLRHYLTASST